MTTVALLGALLALPAPALAEPIDNPEPIPVATDGASTEALAEPAPTTEPPAATSTEPASGSSNESSLQPAATPSPTPTTGASGFTIDHAWVDPTIVDSSGDSWFSATFDFPPIPDGVHSVVHASAPSGLATLVHCQIARPANGTTTVTCVFRGTRIPGDTTLLVSVRSEEGHNYSGALPVTMCPLSGCSPLFEVAATTAAAVETCPGEVFSVDGSFDFNVPWNASGASLGVSAPGGLSFSATGVRDGSSFRLMGSFSEPGAQTIPIIVTDEFGVDHQTSVLVTVASPNPAQCGSLAATGVSSNNAAMIALAALVLGVAGALGLQQARARRTAEPLAPSARP